MKYYEKNYDKTSTIQCDIQYLKFETSETAAENVLDPLKKGRNNPRVEKCILKKSTFSMGNVGNFNSVYENNCKEKEKQNKIRNSFYKKK